MLAIYGTEGKTLSLGNPKNATDEHHIFKCDEVLRLTGGEFPVANPREVFQAEAISFYGDEGFEDSLHPLNYKFFALAEAQGFVLLYTPTIDANESHAPKTIAVVSDDPCQIGFYCHYFTDIPFNKLVEERFGQPLRMNINQLIEGKAFEYKGTFDKSVLQNLAHNNPESEPSISFFVESANDIKRDYAFQGSALEYSGTIQHIGGFTYLTIPHADDLHISHPALSQQHVLSITPTINPRQFLNNTIFNNLDRMDRYIADQVEIGTQVMKIMTVLKTGFHIYVEYNIEEKALKKVLISSDAGSLQNYVLHNFLPSREAFERMEAAQQQELDDIGSEDLNYRHL